MIKALLNIIKKLIEIKKIDKTYKRLRRHLNKMPVGFPSTFSGVELRILKTMFSVDDALLALNLDYKFKTIDEIHTTQKETNLSTDELYNRLSGMGKSGAILIKEINGKKVFALVPLIIGMYELQTDSLKTGYYLDIREYVSKIFAIEYLSTAVPQSRIIPVEKSITPDIKPASYDEIRSLVMMTEKSICVAECICRKGKDLLGEPCSVTDRRELCLYFHEFGDTFAENNWGREVSKEKALEILEQSQKEGLVLQPSNEQEPQFICACCGCCCGLLEMVNAMPCPANFVASNYYVENNSDSCKGCTKCVDICQMDAVQMKDNTAVIDRRKCIGCGVCVAACKVESLSLIKKQGDTIPPQTTEDLYDVIMSNKKKGIKKYFGLFTKMLFLKR